MNNIKTYEGFFDFFKKKKNRDLSLYDIRDCLWGIIDEGRIKSQLNGDTNFGKIPNKSFIFKRNDGLSLSSDHDDFMDELFKNTNVNDFMIEGDSVATVMGYSINNISDYEVSEILKECSERLKGYGCDVSYFIACGSDDFSIKYSNKEWFDFNEMIKKSTESTMSWRNIVIKIKSNSKLIYESNDYPFDLELVKDILLELKDNYPNIEGEFARFESGNDDFTRLKLNCLNILGEPKFSDIDYIKKKNKFIVLLTEVCERIKNSINKKLLIQDIYNFDAGSSDGLIKIYILDDEN
jgi:hypothetical protein